MIELRHIKYFSVLADELNFSRAAEKLFITQPPLSRQIKELETKLGVPLFNRNNKKVELTRYGRFFKDESEKIMVDIINLEKNLQLMKDNNKGVISIGYVGAVMFSFFPRVFKDLKNRFPDVHFVLKELDNNAQIDSLKKNLLDIGFIRSPINTGRLKSIKVESCPYAIVIPDNHALSNRECIQLSDLQNEPFIQFSRLCAPPIHKSISSIFRKEGIEPLVVHETSQLNALLRLVESGFGYSIVPANIKQGSNLGVKYIELKEYNETAEISIIYNKDYVNKLSENVIDHVKTYIKKKQKYNY